MADMTTNNEHTDAAAFRLLVAAGNRIDAEAEEFEGPDGMAVSVGLGYWNEFGDALERARAALAAAPGARQQDAQRVADERAAFTAWAEVEYRHAKQYDVRDYTLGLTAWQARAALAAPQAAALPLTPDEARQAAKFAQSLNGPSDATSPTQYVMAGALAAAAKAAQSQSSGNALPARDATKPAEAQGLFRKFDGGDPC